nr:tyrosine-type recombinase/integrase [Lederbergia lenta]
MFKIYTGEIDPRTGREKSTTRRGFKSITEARTAARHMYNEIEAGKNLKNKPVTYKEFSNIWLDSYIVERNPKPGTVDVRKRELNKMLLYFDNVKLFNITGDQIQKAFLDLNKTMASSTLGGIFATNNMLFRKALQMQVIKEDPTEFCYLPKKVVTIEDLENEKELPKYMEKEELALFLNVCKNKGLELDYEIFLTFAYTGLRGGELSTLKETDILDFDGYHLSVTKTLYNPNNNVQGYQLVTPKSKSSRRMIDIDPLVYNALKSIIERNAELKEILGREYHDTGFIFVDNKRRPGYPFYRAKLQRRMDRILKLAGLNEDLTLHSFRHTHTSLLSEAGVSLERIMERLGHSSDKVTKQIYLHTTKAVKKNDAEKFGNLMKKVVI